MVFLNLSKPLLFSDFTLPSWLLSRHQCVTLLKTTVLKALDVNLDSTTF